MDEKKARETVRKMQIGEVLDFGITKGILISRKDVFKAAEDQYEMLEGVSGEWYTFTEDEIVEFLAFKGWYWNNRYGSGGDDAA